MSVGARYEDGSATGINGSPDNLKSNAGAVYVFARTGTTWSQEAYLKRGNASPLLGSASFGGSVALSGSTLVVSVQESCKTGSTCVAASAYVFTRSGTTWQQEASIPGVYATVVAIAGDMLATGSVSSGVRLYKRVLGTWSQQCTLTGSGQLGSSVAVLGWTVLTGAPTDSSYATGINGNPLDTGLVNAGAAHLYDVAPP